MNYLHPARLVAGALALAGPVLSGTAVASTVWDESLAGDLSSLAATPTPLTFGVGSNLVTGTIQAPGDTRDFLTFVIAPDQQLTGLLLMRYAAADPAAPGNRGYHALNAGAVGLVPAAGNTGSFLGGAHLDPAPAGTDLLPLLASAPLAGTGFAAPLGPGTYSYVIQQTGADFTRYTLDFRVAVVPVPGAVWLLAGGLAALAGLRRRPG